MNQAASAARAEPLWRREAPLLAALFSVLFWGVGPLLVRGISATTPTIMIVRLTAAIPVMAYIASRTGGRIDKKMMKLTFFPGIFSFLSMALGFEALRHTSIANLTLIDSLAPLLLMVVAPSLLNETVSSLQVLLGLAALAGIGAVIFGAGSSSGATKYGDALAGLGTITWATYLILAKKSRTAGVNSWAFLGGNYAWSAMLCIPWGMFVGIRFGDLDGRDLLLLGSMVVVQGIGAHGLHTWALKHIDVTIASMLTLGCPVISIIGAYFVYNEGITVIQFAGAVCVLVSLSGVINLAQRRLRLERETALAAL